MSRKFFVVALCLSGFSGVLFAQNSASITGTVRDSTGAVIGGANVTLTNTATGTAQKVTTNSSGDYLVAGLPAGKYNLTVATTGFKTFQAQNVVLQINQKARIDPTMEVGEITSQVQVEGTNVAQVETQSAELSGVVTNKEISQIVLNGRNFTQLVTLVPRR